MGCPELSQLFMSPTGRRLLAFMGAGGVGNNGSEVMMLPPGWPRWEQSTVIVLVAWGLGSEATGAGPGDTRGGTSGRVSKVPGLLTADSESTRRAR